MNIELILNIALALMYWSCLFFAFCGFMSVVCENPEIRYCNIRIFYENGVLSIINLIVYIVMHGSIKIFFICCPISILFVFVFRRLFGISPRPILMINRLFAIVNICTIIYIFFHLV